jgi:hypothetical protein
MDNQRYSPQTQQMPPQQRQSQGNGGLIVFIFLLIIIAGVVAWYVFTEPITPTTPTESGLGGVTTPGNPSIASATIPLKADVATTPITTPVLVSSVEVLKDTTDRSNILANDGLASAIESTKVDDWRTLQIGEMIAKTKEGKSLAASDYSVAEYRVNGLPYTQLAADKTTAANVFPASYSIDGNNNTYAQTSNEPTEVYNKGTSKDLFNEKHQHSIYYKLATPVALSSVTVINRHDCCQHRLNGVSLILRDSSNNVLLTKVLTGEQTQTVTVT